MRGIVDISERRWANSAGTRYQEWRGENKQKWDGSASMLKTIVTVIAVSGSLWGMVPAARAADKCTSIQARCAIEVGGTCDSDTGHWSYEYDRPKLVARFTACVSREQSRAARK